MDYLITVRDHEEIKLAGMKLCSPQNLLLIRSDNSGQIAQRGEDNLKNCYHFNLDHMYSWAEKINSAAHKISIYQNFGMKSKKSL